MSNSLEPLGCVSAVRRSVLSHCVWVSGLDPPLCSDSRHAEEKGVIAKRVAFFL